MYIVLEKGWEYNDKYYYRTESAGGIPVKVFNNKKDAQKFCNKKNIEEIRQLSDEITNYFSEDVNFEDYEYLSIINDIFGLELTSFCDFSIPKDATDKQIKDFLSCHLGDFFNSFVIFEIKDWAILPLTRAPDVV